MVFLSVEYIEYFCVPAGGARHESVEPATQIALSEVAKLHVPQGSLSFNQTRRDTQTRLIKCVVLNIGHVGKRLRESELGYPPSYEAPLER